MTDMENKELSGEATPVSEPTPQEAPVTPKLTLEPDPAMPEIPVPEEPVTNYAQTSAQAFHMPEPPHAPEPQPEPQPTPPNYTAQYQAQYGQQGQQQSQQYQAPQYYKQYYNTPPAGYSQKSRLAAALLAITFGGLGIHNFYLGFSSRGVIQLVLAICGMITCGVTTIAAVIWGFVEGIQLFTANSPSKLYDANGVILRD